MYGDTFDYVTQPVNTNMNIPMQPIMSQPAVQMPEVTVTNNNSAYRMPGMEKSKDQTKMVIAKENNI